MTLPVKYHKELSKDGRWESFPFETQKAHISSEVFRAVKWKEKGKQERAENAAARAFELVDMTISDPKSTELQIRALSQLKATLSDYILYPGSPSSVPAVLVAIVDPLSMGEK